MSQETFWARLPKFNFKKESKNIVQEFGFTSHLNNGEYKHESEWLWPGFEHSQRFNVIRDMQEKQMQ